MLCALPVSRETFCLHFGRSDGFYLCCVIDSQITQPRFLPRSKLDRCESLPAWLKRLGVSTLIVGGIGEVARHQFSDLGIVVSLGHTGEDPADVVRQFLSRPASTANPCSTFTHRHHHCRSRT